MIRLLPLIALAACVTACGGGTKLSSRENTRACLARHHVRLGGQLDFVATTATGGALRAHIGDNAVTIVFGETVEDADNINQAYHRFRSKNVGIEDVLRQQGNVVMLWHEHPSDAAQATIASCLT